MKTSAGCCRSWGHKDQFFNPYFDERVGYTTCRVQFTRIRKVNCQKESEESKNKTRNASEKLYKLENIRF